MKILISFLYLYLFASYSNLKDNEMHKIKLTSSEFTEGADIPAKYTCDGQNVSPPLHWENDNSATQSIAIVCEDPDAASGNWVHWLMYNIPPTGFRLPEAIPNIAKLPDGSLQGKNDFKQLGYGGPCPPKGTHRYLFRVYLLDQKLDLPSGIDQKKLSEAMKGHILAEGLLSAKYASTRKRTNVDGF